MKRPILGYASLDGRPTRYDVLGGSAWWFYDGRWHEACTADVLMNARVISEADYKARFGPLPRLPALAYVLARRTQPPGTELPGPFKSLWDSVENGGGRCLFYM